MKLEIILKNIKTCSITGNQELEITGINSGFYIVKAVLNNQISVKKIWIK